MSAISNVGSGPQFSLLQQLRQRNGPGPSDRAEFQARRRADFGSALQAAGVDTSKVDDIMKQVDAAVQEARGSSAGGKPDRSAIRAAVDNVLKNNGVDVAKFHDAEKAQHAQHAHGARAAKGAGKRAGGDGDGDADDGGSAPGVNESSETAQSGSVSDRISILLKSLAAGTTQTADVPAGSLVDVAA